MSRPAVAQRHVLHFARTDVVGRQRRIVEYRRIEVDGGIQADDNGFGDVRIEYHGQFKRIPLFVSSRCRFYPNASRSRSRRNSRSGRRRRRGIERYRVSSRTDAAQKVAGFRRESGVTRRETYRRIACRRIITDRKLKRINVIVAVGSGPAALSPYFYLRVMIRIGMSRPAVAQRYVLQFGRGDVVDAERGVAEYRRIEIQRRIQGRNDRFGHVRIECHGYFQGPALGIGPRRRAQRCSTRSRRCRRFRRRRRSVAYRVGSSADRSRNVAGGILNARET